MRADLDGDGKDETIRGQLEVWTFADVEILRDDGEPVTPIRAWDAEQKVTPLRLRGSERMLLIIQTSSRPGTVTIATLVKSGAG